MASIVTLLSVHPSGSVVLSFRFINGLLLLACFLHLSSTMAPGIELGTPRGRFPSLSSLSGHLSLLAEWFYFLRSEIFYSRLWHLNCPGIVSSLAYQAWSWCRCCAVTCSHHWSSRQFLSSPTWAAGNSGQPRSWESSGFIHLSWLL